jgi:ATP synthase F1 gamma subunit
MSSIKEIKARLRGVETIQKITKAMKMVAASRLRSAQRSAKQSTVGLKFFPSFFQGTLTKEGEKKHLILPVSSERGLCGSINTSVNKSTVYYLADLQSQAIPTDIFLLGTKSRDFLLRNCGAHMLRQIDQMGTKDVSFLTASMAMEELIFLLFDQLTIFFNVCENVASQKVYGFNILAFSLASKEIPSPFVNELDDNSENAFDMFGDCYQFSWTFLFFYVLLQNRTSEQAARVSAMESASKNAGEIIQALRLFYNKARQGSITRELIEIISCANALTEDKRRS